MSAARRVVPCVLGVVCRGCSRRSSNFRRTGARADALRSLSRWDKIDKRHLIYLSLYLSYLMSTEIGAARRRRGDTLGLRTALRSSRSKLFTLYRSRECVPRHISLSTPPQRPRVAHGNHGRMMGLPGASQSRRRPRRPRKRGRASTTCRRAASAGGSASRKREGSLYATLPQRPRLTACTSASCRRARVIAT